MKVFESNTVLRARPAKDAINYDSGKKTLGDRGKRWTGTRPSVQGVKYTQR